MENPSQSYGASPSIWDYTVFTATFHQSRVNVPASTPARLAATRFMHLPRRNRRLSWPCCLLYTEMVFLSADSHLFK